MLQMMKDWKAARNSVLEKKKTDPKKALELNKELTEVILFFLFKLMKILNFMHLL